MEIVIKGQKAIFHEPGSTLTLKGRSAAPIIERAHQLISNCQGQAEEHDPIDVRAAVIKVIQRGDDPARVELHHCSNGTTSSQVITSADSQHPGDAIIEYAIKHKAVANRSSKLPGSADIVSQFESAPAKILRQSESIRTATSLVENLIDVEQVAEGNKTYKHRVSEAFRVTGVFGAASSLVGALSEVEQVAALQRQGASYERRIEHISALSAHVMRGSGYGITAVVGGLELADVAGKTSRAALKCVPILSGIADILEGIASAIKFHTKRIFFSELSSRIKAIPPGQGDHTTAKARAIWSYIHSKVTCSLEEIESQMGDYEELSEEEKIKDLVAAFKKELPYHFFSKTSHSEKVAYYERELAMQLEGLSNIERSELLNLMKRNSIKNRVELAKSHTIEAVSSEGATHRLQKAASELNMQLIHHQWAVIGLYHAMDSEYKDSRFFEVVSIVAGIGSGVIGIAAVAVPGGIIFQVISGLCSAADIGSMAYLNRHKVLKSMGLSDREDLEERLDRILNLTQHHSVRSIS